jgi:hypothetical protein
MDAKLPQSEIPGVYDSLSKTYDIWGKLAETRARNRALELADIKDGQNILEVAVHSFRVHHLGLSGLINPASRHAHTLGLPSGRGPVRPVRV